MTGDFFVDNTHDLPVFRTLAAEEIRNKQTKTKNEPWGQCCTKRELAYLREDSRNKTRSWIYSVRVLKYVNSDFYIIYVYPPYLMMYFSPGSRPKWKSSGDAV